MDQETNQPSTRLPSRTSFLLGFGAAVALLFTVGFFIMLGIVVKGSGQSAADGTSARRAQGNYPAAPSAPPAVPPENRVGTMAPITQQDWVRGNRNAKVSVVEYSDTECPFCKRHHPTMQRIVEDYGGKVNWVYRHFPLTSLHPKAPKEAEATECAGELAGNDGFWRYLDRLFEITPANNGLDPAQLPQIAEFIGLDKTKFEACLNSGKYAQKVQTQAQDAEAAGGTGTPYSVIVAGDQKIPVSGAVPLEQFKALIDPLL